jgi:hypothetical protein
MVIHYVQLYYLSWTNTDINAIRFIIGNLIRETSTKTILEEVKIFNYKLFRTNPDDFWLLLFGRKLHDL